jgi:hypothetical protein
MQDSKIPYHSSAFSRASKNVFGRHMKCHYFLTNPEEKNLGKECAWRPRYEFLGPSLDWEPRQGEEVLRASCEVPLLIEP